MVLDIGGFKQKIMLEVFQDSELGWLKFQYPYDMGRERTYQVAFDLAEQSYKVIKKLMNQKIDKSYFKIIYYYICDKISPIYWGNQNEKFSIMTMFKNIQNYTPPTPTSDLNFDIKREILQQKLKKYKANTKKKSDNRKSQKRSRSLNENSNPETTKRPNNWNDDLTENHKWGTDNETENKEVKDIEMRLENYSLNNEGEEETKIQEYTKKKRSLKENVKEVKREEDEKSQVELFHNLLITELKFLKYRKNSSKKGSMELSDSLSSALKNHLESFNSSSELFIRILGEMKEEKCKINYEENLKKIEFVLQSLNFSPHNCLKILISIEKKAEIWIETLGRNSKMVEESLYKSMIEKEIGEIIAWNMKGQEIEIKLCTLLYQWLLLEKMKIPCHKNIFFSFQ